MCETCGCGLTASAAGNHGHNGEPAHRREEAELYRDLLAANDHQARENREHLLEHGVFAINLMSSPGSGKTTLIEALWAHWKDRVRLGVVEGDLATDRDAARIAALGVPVHQITTGSTCHLDAAMVHAALHRLPLAEIDVLLVENVGNLVCPGVYDLGCHLSGVLLSVAEGDDKVAKYPVVFRSAQFLLITKTDLLPHVTFDPSRPRREARVIKGDIRAFELSAKTSEGLAAFAEYLLAQREALK
jgi:hydrogenase nickel incorporation protein HypB